MTYKRRKNPANKRRTVRKSSGTTYTRAKNPANKRRTVRRTR